MTKLAICVNAFHPSVGGCESVTKVLAEYFQDEFEVFVITRRVKNRDHKAFKGYKVFEYVLGDFRAFDNHLKSINADIVFVYSDMFDFFRHIALKKNNFRLIVALCGANWLYTNKNYIQLFNRNVKNIDKIVCHSVYDRDFKLCDSGNLKSKTVVIPNGVHISEFEDVKFKRDDLLPGLADKQWILNVSNFFPGKGQEHLLEILDTFNNPGDFVYVQLCNDVDFALGEQLETRWKIKTRKLIQKGIEIRLVKNASREEVAAYFRQSNVFAFTSEKEVAPLVLLEAMASGLPWVAADVGNVRGLEGGICIKSVKNQRGYAIFDERLINLFRKNIKEVLRIPKIAESGRKQIEEEMNWNTILPRYRELICGPS